MGRWKPDARSRLEQAALELYSQRGFQQVTVAEIARHAGLTERTFFRHFPDKREVLFSGAGAFQAHLVNALDRAPDSLSAIDAVGAAVEATADLLQERRPYLENAMPSSLQTQSFKSGSTSSSRHSLVHSRMRYVDAA